MPIRRFSRLDDGDFSPFISLTNFKREIKYIEDLMLTIDSSNYDNDAKLNRLFRKARRWISDVGKRNSLISNVKRLNNKCTNAKKRCELLIEQSNIFLEKAEEAENEDNREIYVDKMIDYLNYTKRHNLWSIRHNNDFESRFKAIVELKVEIAISKYVRNRQR